jgi:1-acyl-sn-glycerol-3-phosphate acyltransferase
VHHGPVLLVANHVSWIDIFVINAVRPTVFVAKSEIQHWPVLGRLVRGAGTLFIPRRQRHAVRMVGRAMQQRFQCGEAVGLFPEGTTTTGFAILPFHCSLFEPARHAEVVIQPLALRFLYQGRRDAYAAFVGEETLAHNLWRVLSTPGLTVEAVYLPPFSVVKPDGTRWTRAELARMTRHAIQKKLAEGGLD